MSLDRYTIYNIIDIYLHPVYKIEKQDSQSFRISSSANKITSTCKLCSEIFNHCN